MGSLGGIPCRISIRIAIYSPHWAKGYRVRRLNTINEASRIQNLQSKLLKDWVVIWCLTRGTHGVHFRPVALESSTHACRIIVVDVPIAYIGPELQGKIAILAGGQALAWGCRHREGRDLRFKRRSSTTGQLSNGILTIENGFNRMRERVDKGSEDLLMRLEAIQMALCLG
ncbi:hypothetical protein KCU86_g73, partial [Aureobasidium melanogenum]